RQDLLRPRSTEAVSERTHLSRPQPQRCLMAAAPRSTSEAPSVSTAAAPLEAPTSTGDYRLEAGINAGGRGSLPPAVGVGSLPVTEAVSGEPDLPSFGLKSPRGRSPVER